MCNLIQICAKHDNASDKNKVSTAMQCLTISLSKGEFTQYPFFVRFRPFFLRFCFSLTKYALFHPHFYVSISALTRQSHTGQKLSEKIFCKGVRRYFEISLLSFIHKIFEQNFYLNITVYLVRIWTYKNADEKAHTFSRRSKNVKKRTKTYEKRILCKLTLTQNNVQQYY